jgi:hypothetical protein
MGEENSANAANSYGVDSGETDHVIGGLTSLM